MITQESQSLNEMKRLETLRRYKILDTPPDGTLDRVTEVAARLFDMPIALISFVDENRIWFKSRYGMELPEIDRNDGLFAYAIMSPNIYTVKDTYKDTEAFKDSLAGKYGLRFYTGAPLQTHDGYRLGTLCLMDKKPRTFNADRERILSGLATIVMNVIDLKLHCREATEQQEQLKAEVTQLKTDISLQKTELETKLKRCYAEMELKNDKLLESNEELEQFIYTCSHDLTEPLRMVSVFTQLFKRKYEGAIDKDADEYISFICEGAGRMNTLINSLLIFFNVGKEKQDPGLVDCNQVLDTVLAIMRDTIKKHKAKIEFGNLPVVMGKKVHFIQLLQNIIDNAIKFNGTAQPVITIKAEKRVFDWLFSISDNGIGIDQVYQSKIFAVFRRLHAHNVYEGMGMGLAICKKIIDYNKGEIWFESEPGKGTTFYFTVNTAYSAAA